MDLEALTIEIPERRTIPGTDDRYSVSRDGRVFSEARAVSTGLGRFRMTAIKELSTKWNKWYKKEGASVVLRPKAGGKLEQWWIADILKNTWG